MRQLLATMLACIMCAAPTAAQSDTEFTYQGTLNNAGSPANGAFNLEISLWDAFSNGRKVLPSVFLNGVAVSDGLFSVELDFGAAAFDNSGRWLEIEVNGSTLSPRQAMTRSPYSIQTRGIFVDNEHRVGLGTTQPETELHIKGVQPAMRLQIEGDRDSYSEIREGTSSQLRINKVHGSGGTLLDLNPKPADGLGSAEVRFFRETDTTGPKTVQFLRGNFTTETSARIGVDGTDSFFQAHGGNLGIGNASPAHRLDVVGSNATAAARIKGGADATPTGGGQLVLGDQSTKNIVLDSDEISARFNGSPTRLRINPNGGSVEFGPQETRPPFAYGRITADGTIISASTNVRNLLIRSPESAYRLLMTDGNELLPTDIVVVTPLGDVAFGVSTTEVLTYTGRLDVRVKAISRNSQGLVSITTVDSDFCFVVYRP